MSRQRHLAKHGIVRSAIRDDLLCFGLPGMVVFFVALVVCARDGYDGLLRAIWGLLSQPRSWRQVSVPNLSGLIVFVFGLTVAIVAVVTLGRCYSSSLVIRRDHRLVTHGIYQLTRHPIYFGVIVACYGIPVFASSLAGLILMSALIPIFLIRIRMEEKLLVDEFGEAYRSYRARTRKLIPFVY